MRDELQAFVHLWDGSEAGWLVYWIRRHAWRIRVCFDGTTPTVDEVRRIRELMPHLREMPAAQLMKQLRGHDFVEHPDLLDETKMRALVERALALGLRTATTALDQSCGLPVKDGQVLLIEDDVLAQEVCKRMLESGVPRVEVEPD